MPPQFPLPGLRFPDTGPADKTLRSHRKILVAANSPRILSRANTTQHAPLERYLARQRKQQVSDYAYGRVVLDFGCGAQAWTARELRPLCQRIDGVEPSIAPCTIEGIRIVSCLEKVQDSDYNLVLALAVFEHLQPQDLRKTLNQLSTCTVPDALIVGTMPTPLARPVLEFLSYRLGLIDPSQIRDHKVYYDDLWLHEILQGTPWDLQTYRKFQLGMNSFFVLAKRPCLQS